MVDLILISCLLATVCFITYAAYSDLCFRKIENRVSLAIAGAFCIFGLTRLTAHDYSLNHIGLDAIVALCVLIVGFLLFQLNTLGAGDAKFAAALALFAGVNLIAPFLILVALSGGVVALLTWLYAKKLKQTKRQKPIEVPYGIALAIGGFWVIGQNFYSILPL